MGMPDKDIYEALKFCASLGLDGIEIRCAANGHMDPETIEPLEVELIAEAAHRAGVAIACLTPYYKDYATPEATAATLAGLRKTCRIARQLNCPLVRATGGVWPAGDREREDIWERTVAGLRQAADIAEELGAKLALENHSGTLTQTAEDTVAMVEQVVRPNFGILMDHYWVVAAGRRSAGFQPASNGCQQNGNGCQQDAGAPTALLDAVRLQAPYVLHCHMKNLVWVDGKPQANFLDEGEIDWLPVLRILQEHGYDGYLSDEYEKFWRPELPEPEEGMARNARYLRAALERL